LALAKNTTKCQVLFPSKISKLKRWFCFQWNCGPQKHDLITGNCEKHATTQVNIRFFVTVDNANVHNSTTLSLTNRAT